MIGPLYAWIITWATRQGSHLEMEGSGLKLSRKKKNLLPSGRLNTRAEIVEGPEEKGQTKAWSCCKILGPTPLHVNHDTETKHHIQEQTGVKKGRFRTTG